MLVLSRKRGESVCVSYDRGSVRITVIDIRGGGSVRLGIEAPKDVSIQRAELQEILKRARHEALEPDVNFDPEHDSEQPPQPSELSSPSRSPRSQPSPDVIPENQMTANRLVEMLRKNSIKVMKDRVGNLTVTMESGVNVRVQILAGCPWLRLRREFFLSEETLDTDKFQMLKTLNGKSPIRFDIPHPKTLLAEMFLPYFGGLAPDQLLSTLRCFVEYLEHSLRGHTAWGEPL